MSFSTIGQGLLGGVLIGMSAAALLLGNGDILGASGIVSSVAMNPKQALTDPSQRWKLFFLASFLSTSAFIFGPRYDIAGAIAATRPISKMGYGISGFLVGLGTKLSNGCTSGHGVCGLARLSRRSFAAVCTFMVTGIVTNVVTSPNLKWAAGWSSFLRTESTDTDAMVTFGQGLAAIAVAAAVFTQLPNVKTRDSEETKKIPIAVTSGALFASGLYVSGMAFPEKVTAFLEVTNIANGTWDATLLGVLGGAVAVSFLSYQFLDHHSCKPTIFRSLLHPITLTPQSKFNVPSNTTIDKNLIIGSSLFGMGWGITGFCPGPALLAAGVGFPAVLVSYWPAFFLGTFLGTQLK
jgi:uncharacterized membrane protein YedE/YeeE